MWSTECKETVSSKRLTKKQNLKFGFKLGCILTGLLEARQKS